MTGAKTTNERLVAIMAVFVTRGGAKGAAHHLGIREGTVHGYVNQLYSRLGVSGQVAALQALGWLKVPADVDQELARHPRLGRADDE